MAAPPNAAGGTTPTTVDLDHAIDSSKPRQPLDIIEQQPQPQPREMAIESQTAETMAQLPIPQSLTYNLYISHFLSTWNSRLFEFGATLFLAVIYPGTLLPMSVYAIARNGAAILLSPTVGSWIDGGNRLNIVRVSIIGQRLAVAGSCAMFLVMVQFPSLGRKRRDGVFAGVVVLACIEKLCSVMNLVSVERDWVVVITEGNEFGRRMLNAKMRRIDLFCKLAGPLVISLIDGASTIVAIWITMGFTLLSVIVEYFTIYFVYKKVPGLQRLPEHASGTEDGEIELGAYPAQASASTRRRSRKVKALGFLYQVVPLPSLPFYFRHQAFLPSFALALLYLTVLSFSGQMITFLLNSGYNSTQVGITRTVSTVFELSATWIAPRVAKRIGSVRAGIWFLTWEMLWLAVGVSWFFADGATMNIGGRNNTILAASGLVAGVVLSRVGLWGYDLSAQNIVQDEVDDRHRGGFSTVEASCQNLFELLGYATTIVWSKPEQFAWPTVISVVAVYVAGGLYAYFVRSRRGHLLHLDRPLYHCVKGHE